MVSISLNYIIEMEENYMKLVRELMIFKGRFQ